MPAVSLSQSSALTTIKTYYQMTKPGIIRGNTLTAIAGFMLASAGTIDVRLLLNMLIGLSLIIASGCVCNNYIDRDIDSRMDRTMGRALVTGSISGRSALLFAFILGLSGTVLLLLTTNLLTTLLAVFGFIAYVVIYGIAKRRSIHGTIVGSISGAIPPVVGYVAVRGGLDLAAALLFVILVVWQMPHFFAIAMYRKDDYKAAGIPVMPVVHGIQVTKRQIVWYIGLFAVCAASLTFFEYTSYFYLVVMTAAGLAWLKIGLRGLHPSTAAQNIKWARQMFGFSLVVISLFCLTISIDGFI